MRVAVIGGTGHIGSYLVPRLVGAGHDVVSLSRGAREPYHAHPAWSNVHLVHADREAEEADGSFGSRVADLDSDAVVDLTCFTVSSAELLLDALQTRTNTHLIHCGTVWVHGDVREVPVRENAPRRPFGAYGVAKAAIEKRLLEEYRRRSFAVTIVHPGHIVGQGWAPIGPAGNRDPKVIEALAHGREVTLPNLGLETLHHVHADDVAQAFELAVSRRAGLLGESFHVASERAITLKGYAEAVASWFDLDARIRFAPLSEWESVESEHAAATLTHVRHSTNVSIAKARQLLGYAPRYTSLQAIAESVRWLAENGQLDLGELRPPL